MVFFMLPLPLPNSHLASDFTLLKTGFLSLLVFLTLVVDVVNLDRFLSKLRCVRVIFRSQFLEFLKVM